MPSLRRLAIVAVVVLALGGAIGGIVIAQTDGDPSRPFSNFLSRLAENLGITETELQDAIDTTSGQIVDEKVAAGDLTEEQAARIRERIESGEGRPFFGGFGGSKGFGHGSGFGFGLFDGDLTTFLGISDDDLRAARADGQSLAQIAEANGVSRDDLIAFLVGQREEQLAAAVEAGKIDQSQADQFLDRFQQNVDGIVDGTASFGPGRWHHGSGFPFHEGTTPEAEGTVF